MLKDSYGRVIRDLRISVTDRCNFRCSYCKTPHGIHYVDREELLSYEEISRLARVFVDLGIAKIRVTGGEPLLRKDLELLVEQISDLRRKGLRDLALTTNGFNFYLHAEKLKKAGLDRVTISLDSLREERFFEITRSRDLEKVIRSIEVAREFSLDPVKVNCVVIRGFNDDELVDFARFAQERELEVRFIEFMPIDEDEKWSREQVVIGEEILKRISRHLELVPEELESPSQTSRNYSFEEGQGKVGLIMSVSRAFCGECSRIRLTADGKIRTCLFSHVEYDVKTPLRKGISDKKLRDLIISTVLKKEEGHRINEPDFVAPSRTMSYIGG